MIWTAISVSGCRTFWVKWPLLAQRRAAHTVALHSTGVDANDCLAGAPVTGGPPFCHTCKWKTHKICIVACKRGRISAGISQFISHLVDCVLIQLILQREEKGFDRIEDCQRDTNSIKLRPCTIKLLTYSHSTWHSNKVFTVYGLLNLSPYCAWRLNLDSSKKGGLYILTVRRF